MSTDKNTGAASKWDDAIKDAQKRIQRLQSAIRTLEEKKQRGEKWPGIKVSGSICADR